MAVTSISALCIAATNIFGPDDNQPSSPSPEDAQRALEFLQEEGLVSGGPPDSEPSISFYTQNKIDEIIADLGFPNEDECLKGPRGSFSVVDCDDDTVQYRVDWHYHPGEYRHRDPESNRIRASLCDGSLSYVVDTSSDVEDPDTATWKYELLAVGCIENVE